MSSWNLVTFIEFSDIINLFSFADHEHDAVNSNSDEPQISWINPEINEMSLRPFGFLTRLYSFFSFLLPSLGSFSK